MNPLIVRTATAMLLAALALAACTTSKEVEGERQLVPGDSIPLSSGASVLVPAGTVVRDPVKNNVVHVNGHRNVVVVPSGSVVTVSPTATPPADNLVRAR